MATPSSSSSASTIRFMRLLKQPISHPSPSLELELELDESDVIWSSNNNDPVSPTHHASVSPTSAGSGRSSWSRSGLSGLSAALESDDAGLSGSGILNVTQRRRAVDPSFSSGSAAKSIPPPLLFGGPRSSAGGSGGFGAGSCSGVGSGSGNGSSGGNGMRIRSGEDEKLLFGGSSSPKKKYHQSLPINVPVWPRVNKDGKRIKSRFDEVEDDMNEEMLPPHEIVAKTHAERFSVFEGVGRTLKGRDLREVRNAIWQKTGFLD